MAKAAKSRQGETVNAKHAVADVPAKISTATVVEPADPPPEDLRILPPAVEQWLRRNRTALAIGLFLVAATLAVYGQTLTFEFVSYDDTHYVYDNYHVKQGFTPASIEWAFTGVHSANWHPLTSLSHILDWTLFGPWAGGHHLINVLLHAASSVILFIALRRLTGATWRSGMVAALFCLHPLHVESVAWVSERKDVLSGLFFGLTLWSYAAYAEAAVGREQGAGSRFHWGRYLLVVTLYALGLLSKPTLVTLPFLLLLLDYWPLGRWDGAGAGSGDQAERRGKSRVSSRGMLVLEKLPLFALSAASCLVTYLVQKSSGALTDAVSPMIRAQTVVLGYARYLRMLVWPFDLAVCYPRDRELFPMATALCGLALAIVSAALLIWCRRRWRYLLVGWFWYAVTLLPMIGLLTIGDQAVADRYTYLAFTGLFVAIVWAGAAVASQMAVSASRFQRFLAGMLQLAVPVVLITFFAVRAIQVTRTWRDGEALWRNAIAKTANNARAQASLAADLWQAGGESRNEAMTHLREALQIAPRYYLANYNMGIVLLDRGDFEGAAKYFRVAIEATPNMARIYNDLGVALARLGREDEAMNAFLESLRRDPGIPDAEQNLATILLKRGKFAEAASHYQAALEAGATSAKLRARLGISLAASGDSPAGVAQLIAAVDSSPDDASIRHELAKIYHSLGRLQDAEVQWRTALESAPGDPASSKGLGIVLVKTARGAEAVPLLRAALAAAPNDLEARQFLVLALVSVKHNAEAMAEFAQVLRLDPKDQFVLKQLEKVASARPREPFIRGIRAYALLVAKQAANSVAEFHEVLRLDAENLDALNSLAWIEATHPDAKLRNGKEAVEFAEKAAKLRNGDVATLDTLAAAYAQAGRFKEAVATARKAILAAEKTQSQPLIDGIAARLRLYEAGKPYRDRSMSN